MRALAAAYPDQILGAEYRDGDWAALLRDQWFYYAQGRLLPEELRDQAGDYDPQPFYNYIAELPPWHDPTSEESERYERSASTREANPPKRSQHFYDALWQAHTRAESYERLKTIFFLGRELLIHYAIMEEVTLVEVQIKKAAETDAEVRRWIEGLDTLSAWSWRTIADTESRSFHAYGIAIDLLPASTGGRAAYWLWTADYNPRWWAVPYEQRLHPPDAVIRAFESYGFVWGGKWTFYDTMHFEFRPEILLLSGLSIARY
ncbi:MAG: M15 family metallopeptidase [Treponema sp.]|jgi:hypothetical protein|nr:M15 family metallopeptidase [Treponema sp.]